MLAKRIIPCLDVMNGRVVKGINFVSLRDAGDPVEQAHHLQPRARRRTGVSGHHRLARGPRHCHRHGAQGGRCHQHPLYRGRRTAHRRGPARMSLLAGADKTLINSSAVRTPELISEGAKRFGIAVHRGGDRRQDRGRRPLAGVHQRRARAHRPGCGRLGARGAGSGRRRDPADQHGPRRHQERLRPGDHPRRRRRRVDPGDRLRRRGHAWSTFTRP